MSRSATALAYELEVDQQPANQPTPGIYYRLLGAGSEQARRPWEYWAEAPRPRPVTELEQLALLLDREGEANAPWPPSEQIRSPSIPHPQWLVGTLLGIAALAAVVSPVFAAGKSDGSARRLLLSGYAGHQQAWAGAPVVEIDTTTAQAPADQSPQEQASLAAPTSGSYELTAPPSLSVAQIEAVFNQYGSPAVGTGLALHDLGVRYGLDPAYALAFFVHESACGTKGVARFTKSLGNIRSTEGFRDYEGYRSYDSWVQGYEDWYRLITDLYIAGWNLRTVDEIIPVYAPSADNNNPPAYIASVKAMVDSWRGK